MPLRALRGARVFTGDRFLERHAVLLDGDRIADLLPEAALPADLPAEDLGGGTLAPGFLDAQVNGGGGVLFNAAPTAEGAASVAAAHRRTGTTGCLPTFITDRPERQAEAVAAVRAALAERRPGVLGIHLEGPHLSVARKGAHDPALIRPLDDRDLDALLGAGIPTLLVTVAAETVTPAQIRRLADGGVIVSLGHSDAPYDVVMAAADAGARCVTHLFNAMSPLGHRAPGVVGAALDHGGLWGSLIADGVHVDPAALRAALRGKRGPGRLFLISDAMPPAGAPGDTFTLSGRTVTRHGGASGCRWRAFAAGARGVRPGGAVGRRQPGGRRPDDGRSPALRRGPARPAARRGAAHGEPVPGRDAGARRRAGADRGRHRGRSGAAGGSAGGAADLDRRRRGGVSDLAVESSVRQGFGSGSRRLSSD